MSSAFLFSETLSPLQESENLLNQQGHPLSVDSFFASVPACARSPKNLIEDKSKNQIVMKGGMGKKQRQATLEVLESLPPEAEKAILATGRYLGEGFDHEMLDTLFLTLPISWRGTLTQYAGRLHRIHEMKNEVVIYDYADLEVPMLSRMYQRRLQGYKSIGHTISE